MTVLVAHYSDDWQSGSEGTKVFANTEAGIKAAINWIGSNIPYIEKEHFDMYFAKYGYSITMSEEAKEKLRLKLSEKEGWYVDEFNCGEKYAADFKFFICVEEVEEG
jgi:hypothetical protein